MILDCCAQQRTFEKFYGLLAQVWLHSTDITWLCLPYRINSNICCCLLFYSIFHTFASERVQLAYVPHQPVSVSDHFLTVMHNMLFVRYWRTQMAVLPLRDGQAEPFWLAAFVSVLHIAAWITYLAVWHRVVVLKQDCHVTAFTCARSCQCKLVCQYTGWPIKNVPNFRMALCNREIKINQLSNKYLMSKHMQISLDIFA